MFNLNDQVTIPRKPVMGGDLTGTIVKITRVTTITEDVNGGATTTDVATYMVMTDPKDTTPRMFYHISDNSKQYQALKLAEPATA